MRELQPTRRPLRGIMLAGLLALLAVCWCCGSAFAAGGALINVGPAFGGGKPAVAVDSAGTAYVVWPAAPAEGQIPNTLSYCVLPAGASSCAQQGTLVPGSAEKNKAYTEGVSVAIDGSSVVVVAEVVLAGEAFEGVQEWIAADGTASFAQVDGGHPVTDPPGISTHNLIVLPGTNALGYGIGEVEDNSTVFSAWTGASSLSNPPICSPSSCSTTTYTPLNAPNGVFGSQSFAEYASETGGASPGVVGVYDTPFTACTGGGQGISFIYGSGVQSANNSYLIAPGEPKSAWKPISNIDCTGYHPSIASGPSGFGELEWNGVARSVVYQPFDQANEDFDEPPVTVAGNGEYAGETSVSQDGSGGVYAIWLNPYPPEGGTAAIRFAYSPNGGASWEGPVSLTGGGATPANVSSAVGSGGQGWAVSTENVSEAVQVFAQPFVKGDAYVAPVAAPAGSAGSTPSPPATALTTTQSPSSPSIPASAANAGSSGTSNGSTVTVTVTCESSSPCTLTVTITATEVTVAVKAGAARSTVKRTRTITLATGTFKVNAHSSKKLALHLTTAGKKLLAKDHGHLKGTVVVADKTSGGVVKRKRSISITTKHTGHH